MDKKLDLGKVGLSLSGGGAKGILQASMTKAFMDLGLEYDVLTGVSAGALNASMVHQGKVLEMLDLWMNLKSSHVYNWRPWDAVRPFNKKASLYNNDPLLKLIKSKIDYRTLLGNPKPFYLNVTDMKLKRNLALKMDDFIDGEEFHTFLRASASPPIYFEPLYFRGSPVCDGGLVSNFNIHVARDEGCDTIIVLHPSNDPLDQEVDNIMESIGVVLSAPMEGYLPRELKSINRINTLIDECNIGREHNKLRPIKVVFVRPLVEIDVKLLDFDYKKTKYSRKNLFEIGYYSAFETLKKELCL